MSTMNFFGKSIQPNSLVGIEVVTQNASVPARLAIGAPGPTN